MTFRGERRAATPPMLSICIPQYGRFDHLSQTLESCAIQGCQNFEVCISDGGSPETRHREIVQQLDRCSLAYSYVRHDAVQPYDRNLRFAIGLALGDYCVLMGNDDAFDGEHALDAIVDALNANPRCGVLIPDFKDYSTGRIANRIRWSGDVGSGAEVAARYFRDFSFVSGIVFRRAIAQSLSTDKWDGSEMYQMYIGTRMIALGHSLVELKKPVIRKDILIPGKTVDSFLTREISHPRSILPRILPLRLLGLLVVDAIRPGLHVQDEQRIIRLIFIQLLGITYPFWLFTYRQTQSWRYALGIALGMRPKTILKGLDLSAWTVVSIKTLYVISTLASLVLPLAIFVRIRSRLYWFAKWVAATRRPTLR